MSHYCMHRLGYLNGTRIADCSLSMSHSLYDVCSFDDSLIGPFRGLREAEMQMSLLVDNASLDSAFATLDNVIHTLGYGSNLFFLGNGRICPYCGDYNPSGLLECWRCGGKTKEEECISIKEFPFMLHSYNVRSCGSFEDGPIIIDMDWIGHGEITNATIEMITSSDARLESVPFSYGLQGYYLCQCCGQAVPEGKICPNCGGTRLPFSELMKIDHKCLYCGNKVMGSIVCPGCAATLAGITFRELRGMRQ